MRKLITGGVVGVVAILMSASATFAAVDVSGNGSGSHNSVYSSVFTLSAKTQTGVANLNNKIKVGPKWSKGNSANYNTGGVITVASGDTTNTLCQVPLLLQEVSKRSDLETSF